VFENLESLRLAVLEKGQETKDRLKIPADIVTKAPEGMLRLQMRQDFQRQYKLYDALAMWLEQGYLWSDVENAYLALLAKACLAD